MPDGMSNSAAPGQQPIHVYQPMVSIAPGSPFQRVVVLLLLALGLAHLLRYSLLVDPRQIEAGAVVTLALLLAPVRRWAEVALDSMRRPSWRLANWTALAVSVLATLLLYAFALAQGRAFVPTFHDEHAYLIQMQMLVRGHLWMPQHPMADFFETFHVLVKPVYASIYFPGTALLYAPTAWLHFLTG